MTDKMVSKTWKIHRTMEKNVAKVWDEEKRGGGLQRIFRKTTIAVA